MRYPSFLDVAGMTQTEGNETQLGFELLASCIEAVITEEEMILAEDEPKQAMVEFIESMTASQISKLSAFMNEIPKVQHEVNFTCNSCGTNNTRTIEGMQNFF